MPIAFSKTATTKVCLKADEARPEDERVYFKCRFITYAQREEVYAKLEQARLKSTPVDDTLRLLEEALAIGIVGPVDAKTPKGQDVPCTVAGISEVLSYNEKMDLAYEYPNAVAMGEIDLKKSMLLSSSEGVEAATGKQLGNAASVPPQTNDSAPGA